MPVVPLLALTKTKTVGGWAGQWPEGRTATPKPSRKKDIALVRKRLQEFEREDHRVYELPTR